MPLAQRHSHATDEFDDDVKERSLPAAPRELPADHWQIEKLLRFARTGNQTATIIALCELCSLLEQNAGDEKFQYAVVHADGITLLINILHTDDSNCILASLKLLAILADNVQIRSVIAHIDGIKPLVALLEAEDALQRALAARILAKLCRNSINRSLVRHHNGVLKLVGFLKSEDAGTAVASAQALMVCSRSNSIRHSLKDASILPLLSSLLLSLSSDLLIPVLGIIGQLATDSLFTPDLDDHILGPCVTHLKSAEEKVKLQACQTLFRLSEQPSLRPALVRLGALEPLVALLAPSQREQLMSAAGSIARFGLDQPVLASLVKMGAYSKLAGLLAGNRDDFALAAVLAEALGTAAAGSAAGRKAVRESGALKTLVTLLASTNPALLCNVTYVLGKSSQEPESCTIIDASDSLRLVFSLLKQSSRPVQASAALCISELVSNAQGAAAAVRSLVGAIELLIPLIKARDTVLQAHVCRAIACIARDKENLAVISDHGVVASLSSLVEQSKDESLRKDLALAIETCCQFGNNRAQFGQLGVVVPLARYLKSGDGEVQCASARALHQLSSDPDNARTLASTGVLPHLVELVGSGSADMQKAAAGILANIRTLTRQ